MADTNDHRYVLWFDDPRATSRTVGGKNGSLGEMVRSLQGAGIQVPAGFATTVEAYRLFLATNCLEGPIQAWLERLARSESSLEDVGEGIRSLFLRSAFPSDVEAAIRAAYRELSADYAVSDVDVAVRSSATAEDLPTASFAGQLESFLNVAGEDALLESCRRCYASLFTDRAISYREQKGFDHMKVSLSVGIQKMVRSDSAGAGVMFSIDTETGFPNVVVINAAWGLGESVVQGTVNPDEYVVFKPLLRDSTLRPIIERTVGSKETKVVYRVEADSMGVVSVATPEAERESFVLTDEEVIQLARWACAIEAHYGRPMDMEWAKDGRTGDLFMVQARPETVQSRVVAASLRSYTLKAKGKLLLSGVSVGSAIAAGRAVVSTEPRAVEDFEPGSILITEMTSPDWVPVMKRAAAIVTDHGGRTSHAAIVSRELGIPAVVGTGNATNVIQNGQEVTVSCAEGEEGHVYAGTLAYDVEDLDLEAIPAVRTRIMMNMADPAAAFRWWRLPCRGIGLARMEFIINNLIKVHPMALVRFDALTDAEARQQIEALTRGYEDKTEFFVERLASGIARIAAAQYPEPVIVRTSDFKTNEYANLVGGKQFEPLEENPMLGFRGASRYYNNRYRDGFALECRAIKRVRDEIGLTNVVVMIPFCRTLEEADRVLEVMADNGLERGKDGLEVYVMCEIPSNVLLAEGFAQRFDGFSIGSNDLTQLTLGIDRDSRELAPLFDERNPAVKRMIAEVIETAHRCGSKVGICGQAPSDYPEFAAWLVELGIDSISLNPDSVVEAIRRIADVERKHDPAA